MIILWASCSFILAIVVAVLCVKNKSLKDKVVLYESMIQLNQKWILKKNHGFNNEMESCWIDVFSTNQKSTRIIARSIHGVRLLHDKNSYHSYSDLLFRGYTYTPMEWELFLELYPNFANISPYTKNEFYEQHVNMQNEAYAELMEFTK